MFTVYNCSQLNSLDSRISSQTQPLTLKSVQQVKQVSVCRGFSLFMLRTVILPAVGIIIFLNSPFTLDMLFSSGVSLSAESDQETASLTIDKTPDKCEVGRLLHTIKTENSLRPRR